MRSLTYALLLTIVMILAGQVMAQVQDVKFAQQAGTNGMTLGKINGMVRDKYGFLWFSDQSNRCIVRFDGSHMTRYQNNPQNANSLGGFYPECLATDSSGNIWVGFYGMGLDKFDPVTNTFTHYRHNDKDAASLHNDFVCAVLIDHIGNVWVGNYNGLDLFDQQTGKFKHFIRKDNNAASLSCDTVRSLYEDRAGNLWIGTGFPFDNSNINGGLNLFHRDDGTFTRYMHDPKDPHSLVANKVRAILEDSYGNFWVGTEKDGLHTMDRKTGKFTRYPYDPSKPNQLSRTGLRGIWDHITFIAEDADRKIWIGTLQNGITRYDPVSKQVTHYGGDEDKKGILNDATSWWATSTPDGFVWISTQNANVFKVDIYNKTIPFTGKRLGPDEGFKFSKGVASFNEEGDSVLWLGTDAGLTRKDVRNSTLKNFVHDSRDPNSISDDTISSILKDKNGNFWIGTNRGLNYFNPTAQKFTNYFPDPANKASASNIISRLVEDGSSNIWLGTLGRGLYRINTVTGNFEPYKNKPTETNTISDNIPTLLADGSILWLADDINNGLSQLNLLTGHITDYLVGLGITCLYKDADSIIWAGTIGGLYRYNRATDNFNSFSEDNPGNNIVQVAAIAGDKENNLWISTETGIYMLNKKRDHVFRFGKDYGLTEANNFFYSGSAFTGHDGKLYFGNFDGYYEFFPDKLKKVAVEPKLYITGFSLDNKQLLPGSTDLLRQSLYQTTKIELQHDQNVFAFSATSVDFRNTSDKKIYYKLENYDIDWRVVQPEDKLTYFKVPPGKYIFKIKTPNGSNDDWVEKSIDVIILPPWWTTWWAYCLYGIVLCGVIFFIHRYQKASVIKAEREKTRAKELAQAKEIESAYHELKSTQAQLIQSEKMASLGELTAGIAHEIQNPLNFVNNFSEVNRELAEELKTELAVGNWQTAVGIAGDIEQNMDKINQHGRRADAIVKNMLEHSRQGSGEKKPTEINALADEYLKLAYYGMRAKEKQFNVTMKTEFDAGAGKINIVAQDIGRVLLNLYNNAFYAVKEKAPGDPLQSAPGGYEPEVKVTTKKSGSQVIITVKDNGSGIPDSIKKKIFQPFFTTKPTGQGTGLGLSLAYDIVKAHGGQLKVETKEGEGSEFIIQL